MKNNTFGIAIALMLTLIGCGIASPFFNPQTGSFIFMEKYDPETDGNYWAMLPQDQLWFGFYDTYNFADGRISTNGLLHQNIVSINDLGTDWDSLPDLTIHNQLLMGNYSGVNPFAEMWNLDLLALTYSIIQPLLFKNENLDIALPSLSALDSVSSQYLTYLTQLTNDIEMGIENNTDIASLFSYEYSPGLNQNYTSFFETKYYQNNSLKIASLENLGRIGRGLNFSLTNPETQFVDMMPPLAFHENAMFYSNGYFEETLMFKTPNENSDNFTFVIGQTQSFDGFQGSLIGINKTHVGYIEPDYLPFWDDSGYPMEWIFTENINAGNLTALYPLIPDQWNYLRIRNPNQVMENITIENGINETYQLPHFIGQPDDEFYYNITTVVMGFMNGSINDCFYLDNLNYPMLDFITHLRLTDFPLLQVFETLSPNTFRYAPKHFNWTVIENFLLMVGTALDLILEDAFGRNMNLTGIFDSMMTDSNNSFRIDLPSYFFDFILNELLGNATGLGNLTDFFHFAGDGRVSWVLSMEWDKQIGVMNLTNFHVDFLDQGYSRDLGIQLLSTSSVRESMEGGYRYFEDSWYDGGFVEKTQLSSTLFSELNHDIYPSELPEDWSIYSMNYPIEINNTFVNNTYVATTIENITMYNQTYTTEYYTLQNYTTIENITIVNNTIVNPSEFDNFDYQTYMEEYLNDFITEWNQTHASDTGLVQEMDWSKFWGDNWGAITGVSVLVAGSSVGISYGVSRLAKKKLYPSI